MEFHAVSCQTFATSIKHGCLSVFTEYNNRHFSASKSSFVILSCMTSLECCKNIVLTKQPLSLCSWHEEHHFTINRLMITPDWVTLRWNVVTATCHSHSRLAQSAHCRWMRVSHDSCRRECPQSHRRGAGKLCKAAHRKKRNLSVLTAAMPGRSIQRMFVGFYWSLWFLCVAVERSKTISMFSKDEMISQTESFLQVRRYVVEFSNSQWYILLWLASPV